MLSRHFLSAWRKWSTKIQNCCASWSKRSSRRQKSDMATLKRSDADAAQDAPQRSCIACTESAIDLIRPCRLCQTDYCTDCLRLMFLDATTDQTRMPPRCCALIQPHTILAHLTDDEAKRYLARFEKWVAPTKLYCPLPSCSAFIAEKRVPEPASTSSAPSLHCVISDILVKTSSHESARFFRGDLDVTLLPGYTCIVKNHLDLSIIKNNLKLGKYTSCHAVTQEIQLVISNTKTYHGSTHPVSLAADKLLAVYLEAVGEATDLLISTNLNTPYHSLFACPNHHAICSACKQIEHMGQPCDTTALDHEIAMLQTFGYKRCPRCKAGLKKMFGCSHMNCICGASFCYYCLQDFNVCDGRCGQLADEDEDDHYDSEEDDLEGDVMMDEEANQQPPLDHAASSIDAPPSSRDENRIVNLDAGGDRRWGETDYDFGDEPDEQPFSQVWSCRHAFQPYEAVPEDGFDRGDLNRMSCNRCGEPVHISVTAPLAEPARKKRRKKDQAPKTASDKQSDAGRTGGPQQALECSRCRLVVCAQCRDKYSAESAEGSNG